MMLWDSLPIVRLRTQVTQSSPWSLAERTCAFWGRCKYFIDFFTILSRWKSVKNTGYILSILQRLCYHGNPWDRSQVPCRRWWAIPLIPRSCVHSRSLPGNMRPEDTIPGFAVFSRSGNCPSWSAFHLRHALFVSVKAFWLTADPPSHLSWRLPLATIKAKEKKTRSSPQVYLHTNRPFQVAILFMQMSNFFCSIWEVYCSFWHVLLSVYERPILFSLYIAI